MAESDRPLVVDGQTVEPRWAWSDHYRAEVRAMLRCRRAPDEVRGAEDEYLRQWAERRGLPFETDDDRTAVRALAIEEQSQMAKS